MNSRKQPDDPVFFLDRNLGKHKIPEKLRSVRMNIEVHDDHLPQDAPDEDWIRLVGENGWVALTKDKNIRYRHAAVAAIQKYGARVIVIRARRFTGEDIADLLITNKARIYKSIKKTEPPFVLGIVQSGQLRNMNVEK